MPSDLEIIQSLSEMSSQELIGILEVPADWTPAALEFARLELARRSVNIEQEIAVSATRRTEELQRRSIQPLTRTEFAWVTLYGVIGLLGLYFVWGDASRYKAEGYLLKSQRCWRVYGIVFGIRMAVLTVGVLIAIGLR